MNVERKRSLWTEIERELPRLQRVIWERNNLSITKSCEI